MTGPKELLDKWLLRVDDAADSEAGPGPDDYEMETEVRDVQTAKRLQIIDKSITLFAKLGYEAVKVSDITESLQMGKGTFYLYFKNKRELLLASFDRLCYLLIPREMWHVIRNEPDLFVRLRHRWEAGNLQHQSFSGLLNIIRGACYWDDQHVKHNARKAYDVIVRPIRKDLEEAAAKGIIRPLDVELASYTILWLMEAVSFRLGLDSRFSHEEAGDFLQSFLMSALTDNSPSEVRETAAQGVCATVTDMKGTAIDLTDLSFNGSPHLAGRLGDAEMQVDPSRLSAIRLKTLDSKTVALLSSKNGQEVSLEIDDDILITGETAFGPVHISFDRVSQIIFQSE